MEEDLKILAVSILTVTSFMGQEAFFRQILAKISTTLISECFSHLPSIASLQRRLYSHMSSSGESFTPYTTAIY